MTVREPETEETGIDGATRLKLKRLPERKYYAISDVAKETELQPYVLRFWEKEFPMLRPRKSRTNNNRQYQRRDIDLVKRIKHLLYTEGYTIEGARQRLKTEPAGDVKKPTETVNVKTLLGDIRRELEVIAGLLE
ncbi:MAG TPA: MerR family transcriptional regulator [Acidobacteriota bacterium]|nr:MerR family transcriptional regulator [Acidobacteriota bacterium]